ncbi:hypothetical protein MY11210_008055 [Beauveria gryllotalpidicola]
MSAQIRGTFATNLHFVRNSVSLFGITAHEAATTAAFAADGTDCTALRNATPDKFVAKNRLLIEISKHQAVKMSRMIGPRNAVTIEETMSILKGDYDRHMADWNSPHSDKASMLRGAEGAADGALTMISLRERDWPREAQFRRLRARVYTLQNRLRKAEEDTARAEEVEKKIKERKEAGEELVKDVVGV